jgi:hypothetical protein
MTANATATTRADFPELKIRSDATIGAAGINQTLLVIQEFIL